MKIKYFALLAFLLNTSNCLAKPMCIEALDGKNVKSLERKKTSHGVDLKKILASGTANPDSKIGCYAGDMESYEVFSDVFEYVLKNYHHSVENKAGKGYDLKKINFNLSKEAKKLIVSSRVRFARNIAALPFPSSMSLMDRKNAENMILSAVEKMEIFKDGSYKSLEKISEKERLDLIEQHFLFKDISGDKYLKVAGIAGDYPNARGIFLSKDKTKMLWINEEDHVRIISLQEGNDLKSVFLNLIAMENGLKKSIDFAYNDKYGYLASCPTNIGTGMRASVLIRLKKLGRDEASLKKLAKSLNLDIRGINGEHSSSDEMIFDISNSERFGKSAENLIQTMINGVNQLAIEDAKK